jgi:hypothetical protein
MSVELQLQVAFLVLVVVWVIAWPFIRGPIRVHSRNWLSIDAEYEPLKGGRLTRDHSSMIAELAELGFIVRGHWRDTGHSNGTAEITLLEHPQTLDVAKVIVTRAGSRQRRYLTLAFQTRFEDDTELVTANSQVTAGLPRQPRITGLWLPEVRDPGQLFRVHNQVRDLLGVDKRRLPLGQDCIAYLIDGRQQVIDHWVKSGYYYLDQARGVYCHTWKGAVLMTWTLIWPIRSLYRARRRRATHRLLRELGVHVDED